jgi:hypothetical protein
VPPDLAQRLAGYSFAIMIDRSSESVFGSVNDKGDMRRLQRGDGGVGQVRGDQAKRIRFDESVELFHAELGVHGTDVHLE